MTKESALPGPRRIGLLTIGAVALSAVLLAGANPVQAAVFTTDHYLTYAGADYQIVMVPGDALAVEFVVTGGGGGGSSASGSSGAAVRGSVPVMPGESILVGVGGVGQDAETWSSIARGGWGGLDSGGGDGATTDGNLKSQSAAGGGGSSLQVKRANGQVETLVVAGGGGGGGGAATVGAAGDGGDGGQRTTSERFAQGEDGGDGVYGGRGGTAGTESTSMGSDGRQATLGGGNGGGGGGGHRGGGGGVDGQAALSRPGGGGGAGSTWVSYAVQSPAILTASDDFRAKNGEVLLSWVTDSEIRVEETSGWDQIVLGGAEFQPLVLRVTDPEGNPVVGITVKFAIADRRVGAFPGGGDGAQAETDSNGEARSPILYSNEYVLATTGVSGSVGYVSVYGTLTVRPQH